MAVLLLESGSRTLLESANLLLLEPLSVAVETSFIDAFIDGADSRLAIRSDTRAALDLVSLSAVRSDCRVSVVQLSTANVRE